ncbi:MAG TPA: HEAT repeat domain-containing protein [Phototrophicaceae bacterium]|nr:HEAT repeat domain-containing protein [Phototrophicaceae bacterium]
MSNDRLEQALDALGSADVVQRIDALTQLRGSSDARIAPKVIPLLRDANAVVRAFAASALGAPGSSAAVQPLIDALYDSDAPVRVAAAEALGQIGDRAAVPGLIAVLYDEDMQARLAAAKALGLIGDPRAIVDLISVLDKDDIPLAVMAGQALHKIGTPEALAAIQHLREGDHYIFDIPEPESGDETLRAIPRDALERYLTGDDQPEAEETIRSSPGISAKEEAAPSAAPATSATETPTAALVQFSAYAPREVMPNTWLPLRAYVFKASAAAAVAADVAQQLGSLMSSYRPVERPAQSALAEGALIVATPTLAGFQFNPPSAQIAFYDEFERFDFKLRATTAALDQASNGRITFTVEGVIVADVPLSIYVSQSTATDTSPSASPTRPIYRSIFCSYSRQDTQIVQRVERAVQALGDNFLRDVESLKSGEDWQQQLPKLIAEADIFQLFWSPAAAQSDAVKQEWTYALSLRRDLGFIRPVYWALPMPPPPTELAAINFAYEPNLSQA